MLLTQMEILDQIGLKKLGGRVSGHHHYVCQRFGLTLDPSTESLQAFTKRRTQENSEGNGIAKTVKYAGYSETQLKRICTQARSGAEGAK